MKHLNLVVRKDLHPIHSWHRRHSSPNAKIPAKFPMSGILTTQTTSLKCMAPVLGPSCLRKKSEFAMNSKIMAAIGFSAVRQFIFHRRKILRQLF